MPTKSGAKKQTRTTLVPDRSAMPLGYEAALIARFLRGLGADASLVPRPGLDADEKRKFWLEERSRPANRVPMWLLDYCVALLEKIPKRPDRRERGRPRETAAKMMDLFKGPDSTAKTASLVASLLSAGKPEQIEERKEKIARSVYRRRKRDVP